MTQTLGKFELRKPLGQGAMGEVFLGWDPVIGREVAIKTLHPALAAAPDVRERFFREAQAAGRLSHPSLVPVFEFGEDEGRLFLVMEYVPGQDLADALAARSLSPSVVLELLAQVCDGLAEAHRKGILHRDIKPSNIRLAAEPGRLRAKIMDFGIARLQGSNLTGKTTLLGTFAYMAPEYIRTGQPEARSDLFAVGVILYEALAGRRPFDGDTTPTLLQRIVHEEPKPPPLALLKGISPATRELLSRALAKDPAQRFQSAEQLAVALRAARDPAWPGPEAPTGTVAFSRVAVPSGPAVQPRPGVPSRRRSLVPLLTATLVLAALGALYQVRRPAQTLLPPAGVPLHSPVASPRQPVLAFQAPAVPSPAPVAASQPPARSRAPVRTEPKAAPPASAPPEPPPRPAPSLDPSLQRAIALRIVALYQLKRYPDCAMAMDKARQAGLDLQALARDHASLRQVLDREALEHHLTGAYARPVQGP